MTTDTLDPELENETPISADDTDEAPKTLKEKAIAEIPFLIKLVAFLLVFWTAIFGHYKIPSESMQPTLEVGDHLYVSKFPYGFSKHSLPIGLHHLPLPEGRLFTKLPKRGDVVVFRHPYQQIVMIKRVVGLPGDTVRVKNGRLYINDKVIERKAIDERRYITNPQNPDKRQDVKVRVFEEQFDAEASPHLIYERADNRLFDNTQKFTIPADSVFFMGDNRDGSADSRAPYGWDQFIIKDGEKEMTSGPGMVHTDYLIGRADLIMFSRYKCLKRDTGFHCAKKRFFSKIK